jgi:hypothetical protein
LVAGSFCFNTVPMTEAMQMMVKSEMANRMDDSNSNTAWPRGEALSDGGLEVTDVMVGKSSQSNNSGGAPPPTKKAGNPALIVMPSPESPIVAQPVDGLMKTPVAQGIAKGGVRTRA